VKGPSASYTAGSLLIVWEPPGNPSANVFVISLGGSRVSVTAQPGSDVASLGVSTPTTLATTPVAATPAHGGISSTPQTSASPAAAPAKPKTAVNANPIAATFNGLAGQAILGALGCGLLFFGFRRVADDIVDRIPSTCPLETS
jgi:hypothetical protein